MRAHPGALFLAMAMATAMATATACGGGDDDGGVDPSGDGGVDGGGGGDGPGVDAAPTGGCGTTRPTGVQNGTIQVGGVDRTYVLFVPAGYDPQTPTPLVFAWHGRTGTAAGARGYFGIEAAAAGAAIIVYPQGLPVSAEPSDTGWELAGNGRDLAFYDALAERLRATYCIGSSYSLGHSFGGYMSNAVACHRGGTGPGQVRAIAPVAGGGPFGACPGDPVAAVIIHGMTDAVVPFSQGESSRDVWRAEAGCATTSTAIDPAPCVVYDGCPAGRSVRFCAHGETAFQGHGWPAWAAAAAWRLFQATP